jgi:hypothetical protein
MAQAYQVVDVQNPHRVVYQSNSSVDAYRYADRRDSEYGAVRYRVERDYDVMSEEEAERFMARVRSEKAQ